MPSSNKSLSKKVILLACFSKIETYEFVKLDWTRWWWHPHNGHGACFGLFLCAANRQHSRVNTQQAHRCNFRGVLRFYWDFCRAGVGVKVSVASISRICMDLCCQCIARMEVYCLGLIRVLSMCPSFSLGAFRSFQLLRSDDSPSYQPQFVPQPHLTAVLLTFNQGDPQNDLTNCRTGVLLIVGR